MLGGVSAGIRQEGRKCKRVGSDQDFGSGLASLYPDIGVAVEAQAFRQGTMPQPSLPSLATCISQHQRGKGVPIMYVAGRTGGRKAHGGRMHGWAAVGEQIGGKRGHWWEAVGRRPLGSLPNLVPAPIQLLDHVSIF